MRIRGGLWHARWSNSQGPDIIRLNESYLRESVVVIRLEPDLEQAVNEQAQRAGVSPSELALEALRERFIACGHSLQPRDEWERQVLDAGSDCGVSLPHEALSSDGLYD